MEPKFAVSYPLDWRPSFEIWVGVAFATVILERNFNSSKEFDIWTILIVTGILLLLIGIGYFVAWRRAYRYEVHEDKLCIRTPFQNIEVPFEKDSTFSQRENGDVVCRSKEGSPSIPSQHVTDELIKNLQERIEDTPSKWVSILYYAEREPLNRRHQFRVIRGIIVLVFFAIASLQLYGVSVLSDEVFNWVSFGMYLLMSFVFTRYELPRTLTVYEDRIVLLKPEFLEIRFEDGVRIDTFSKDHIGLGNKFIDTYAPKSLASEQFLETLRGLEGEFNIVFTDGPQYKSSVGSR